MKKMPLKKLFHIDREDYKHAFLIIQVKSLYICGV